MFLVICSVVFIALTGRRVDAKVLLQLALEHPEIHVRANSPLASDCVRTALPEFKPIFSSDAKTTSSVCASSGYEAGSWVPIVKARESFDEALGGPEGFDKWVLSGLMINASEAYDTHNTIEKVTWL